MLTGNAIVIVSDGGGGGRGGGGGFACRPFPCRSPVLSDDNASSRKLEADKRGNTAGVSFRRRGIVGESGKSGKVIRIESCRCVVGFLMVEA